MPTSPEPPRPPLSVGRLALGFMALVSVLTLGIGAYAVLEIDRLAQQQQAREQAAAQQEALLALDKFLHTIHAQAQQLAHWDETRQQLFNPEYYPLWRDDRVRDAGLVPASVTGVALYRKDRHILSEAPGANTLPPQLPATPPLLLYTATDAGAALHVFTAVHADPEASILLGYVGLRHDLYQELSRIQNGYQHADIQTIQFKLPRYAVVTATDLRSAMTVEVRTNPELVQVQHAFHAALWRMLAATLCSLLLALALLHQLIIRPLHRLAQQIDRVREQGPLTTASLPDPLPILELEKVRYSFHEYQAKLVELHRNLAQTSQDFYHQARRDALTNAYNRRALDEDWQRLAQDAEQFPLALLLFDCDHFKAINDSYGHPVGDAVITGIAEALQAALRPSDRLYRLGGDEFATLLCLVDTPQALRLAELSLAHVQSYPFRAHGVIEPVSLSIGIACSAGPISLYELQKQADLAMYAAKRPGGRKIICYTPDLEMLATLVSNRSINAVFQAITNPALLELHYQPVVRLPEQTPDYAEALVRIRLEEGPLLMPDAIFPIVSARGLEAEFDLAILQALHTELNSDHFPARQGVSFNLSAQGIVHPPVIEQALRLVRGHPGRKLIAEITETALITQIETASAHIRRLREAGIQVALDDFGSGYSSLRYLAAMPVDLVKFDISMVRMLTQGNARQRRMLEGVIHMVVEAGYGLIAEGIETEAILQRVLELGFSHAQGYYCGRPAPLTLAVPEAPP